MRFAKKIVLLVIVMNIGFTALIMYLFLQTGSEPTTLVGCWFAFTTTELWALSKIQINTKNNQLPSGSTNQEEELIDDKLETETEQSSLLDSDRRLRDGAAGGAEN